jgi:hypothetical protein
MGRLRPHYSVTIKEGGGGRGGGEEGDYDDDNGEGEKYVPHKQELTNASLWFVTGYRLGG